MNDGRQQPATLDGSTAKLRSTALIQSMNRRVGRSAETRFATLCAEAGAICNEPKEDESGWDFVVTLPRRRGIGVSADMIPPPPPVLVQVKSHVAKHRRLTVKLSNALTFAHSPLPCFLVLMLLPDAGEPMIYATDVWDSLISRTFKRAREAARDGVAEDRLHKQTMTVSFTEQDRHDYDLLAWMEATVAGQGRDYAAAKRHLQNTVGFEGGNVGGVLQIGPLASIEELVDHQLGLSPSIVISKVTLQSRRFGIALDLPMPNAPITHARLTSNPVDACVIRLRGPDREELTVDAEVIVPAIDVPDNQFKARFRSPILDVIWAWGGESRITGHIDTAAAMTPDLVYKMARIAGWSGQGIIDLKVEARDQRLLGSVARLDGFPDADRWAILADLIAPLAEIARVRKVEPPKITIEQILECEWLEPFFRFVTQTDMTANVVLDDGVEASTAERAIMFALVQVGRWIFCVLVQQSIREQSQEGEHWTIRFDKPEQLERYVFRDDDAASIRALEADYQRYTQTPGTLGLGNALLRVNPAGPPISLDGEQAI